MVDKETRKLIEKKLAQIEKLKREIAELGMVDKPYHLVVNYRLNGGKELHRESHHTRMDLAQKHFKEICATWRHLEKSKWRNRHYTDIVAYVNGEKIGEISNMEYENLNKAELMEKAINNNYFMYGDSCEWLPKKQMYKWHSAELQQDFYYTKTQMKKEFDKLNEMDKKDIVCFFAN